MNDTFDPYYKWLGIKPKDQPPNHYRLLGVELFESDVDVIENAADQRMRHMRSLQAGANADASQRILNEVAAARVCLTDPIKRAEYDRSLQTVRAVEPPSSPPKAPPAMGTAAPPIATVAPPKAGIEAIRPVAVADRPIVPDPRIPVRQAPTRHRSASKSKSGFPLGLVVGIGALVGTILLIVALLAMLRRNPDSALKLPSGEKETAAQRQNPPVVTTTPPPRRTTGSSPSTTGGGTQSKKPKPTGQLHLAEIAPVTLQPGQQLRVQATVKDPARWQNVVRYAVGLGNPNDVRVDPQSGWVEWSPPKDARQQYLFNIEAKAGADEASTSFRVELPFARGELIFKGPGDQTAYPGEPLSANFQATDDVGVAEGARFQLVKGPEGATIDPQLGQFRWKAGEDQLDKSHRVEVRVTDARGVSATNGFTIRVQKKPPPAEGSGTSDTKSGEKKGVLAPGAPGDTQRRRFSLRFEGQAHVSTAWRYDGNTPLTLEAMVTPGELKQSAVLGSMHLSGVGLTLTGDQHWAFVVRDRDRNRQIVSDEPATADRRVHLAGVFADGKMRLFIDGKPQRDTSLVEKFVPSRHPFLIGADTNADGHPEAFFHGKIQSVRASTRAVYQEPFSRPWRLESGEDTAMLLVFDQGEGDEVGDRCGKNPPAKIHGASWVARERQPQ
ncbi:MAG: LamG domain-containing protein [Planctomycetes bacterium]|nr:LamG domain-containing protein [Planctomycetota bacterium]